MAEQELSFEQAFKEMQETVRKLETGSLSLEDSLALFQRGTELAALCNQRLDQAELRVRQLLPTAGGEMEAVPFGEWKPDADEEPPF
jgi:exodeoxyribonuclease VII small subunit